MQPCPRFPARPRAHRHYILLLVPAIAGALLFSSCNHSFSPKGPFKQQLVTYSLLTDERDRQFVRIYQTYDVDGFDPFQNKTDGQVVGAQVAIVDGNTTYMMRDTILPRASTSHYDSPIHAYVGDFSARRGRSYQLVLDLGQGNSATATVTVPDYLTRLWMVTGFNLDEPGAEQKKVLYVWIYAASTALTKGYAGQMVVQYQMLTPSGWQDREDEVPPDEGYSLTNRVISRNNENGGLSFSRSNVMYRSLLLAITGSNPNTSIVFKRLVFRVLQVDQNLYDYYKIVHGFQDPYTIRYDQPDFTDMSSGFGLFGGYTIDTLVHELPPNFGYNQ